MNGVSLWSEQKKSFTWVRTWAWFRQICKTQGSNLINIAFTTNTVVLKNWSGLTEKKPQTQLFLIALFELARHTLSYWKLREVFSFPVLITRGIWKPYVLVFLPAPTCKHCVRWLERAALWRGIWARKQCQTSPVVSRWASRSELGWIKELPACVNLQSRTGMALQCL